MSKKKKEKNVCTCGCCSQDSKKSQECTCDESCTCGCQEKKKKADEKK